MTISEYVKTLVKDLEYVSNNESKYSHPNDAARLYQVFQDLGTSVGQRMNKLQSECRQTNSCETTNDL